MNCLDCGDSVQFLEKRAEWAQCLEKLAEWAQCLEKLAEWAQFFYNLGPLFGPRCSSKWLREPISSEKDWTSPILAVWD